MTKKIFQGVIVAVIALQLIWCLIQPAGNRLAPRNREMAQALRAFENNRTPANEAAMWQQVHRDDLRDLHREEILFGLMLLGDAVVIYYFWNYGTKKAGA